MTAAEPILSVRDLRVEIPTPRGVVKAVDGVSLDVPRGGALGLVGESGCGKSMTLRAILGLLPGRAQIAGGEIVFDGEALSAASLGDAARRQHRHGLPGADDRAQPGHARRRADRGGAARAARAERGAGARAGARAAAPGRHPRSRAPLPGLPARALGRPAPAHRDRDRAGLRAAAAALRRADDGARRDDPGSDPAPARAPARRDGRLAGARHARSRGRRADLRARRRHVRGAHRRDGDGRRGVRRAAASVHARAAALGARLRRAPRAPRVDRGHAARPRRAALGLPLPPALRDRARRLRDGRSAAHPARAATARPRAATTRSSSARA